MIPRILIAALLLVLDTKAKLLRIEVVDRSQVLDGREFGKTGAYERLRGRAYFSVDPASPANRRIVDLDKAPRNTSGLVEFSADVYVLRPLDPLRGNRTILFEPPNRGAKGMLGMFNRAAGSHDPSVAEHFGDGYLMEDGYTLVWLGWQHDTPLRPELMRLHAPSAQGVSGWVRSEYTPDRPVSRFSLGDAGHVAYRVLKAKSATLTVRDGVRGERKQLAPSAWRIENGTDVVLSEPAIPGRIYEVLYESIDPPISGLGLAAARDLISFLKYGGRRADAVLADQHRFLRHAIGFGSSQSAMMLKALVYEGFNADEKGRRLFDGIFAHVAGGRRATFQRFTQHSRTAGPLRNASLSPTEQFPFSDVTMTDPETGISDGLLLRARQSKVLPKIIYTNSSYEYWGTGAALLHTSVDGKDDIALPPTSRLYLLAGGQHGPAALGSGPGRAQNSPNFNDYRWMHRALLRHLSSWITHGKQPPNSEYPSLAAKTLVPASAYALPTIPNVSLPRTAYYSERLDFGPDYRWSGVIATEPPVVGKPFASLVPQCDSDGIDIAGVKMPWISWPLGTFTGWNFRAAAIGAPNELLSQTGSFIAFPLTKQARAAANDPRPSIEERYTDEADYLAKIREAAVTLTKSGFLLERDIPLVLDTAKRYWETVVVQPSRFSRK